MTNAVQLQEALTEYERTVEPRQILTYVTVEIVEGLVQSDTDSEESFTEP